jgi:hypothetical protein
MQILSIIAEMASFVSYSVATSVSLNPFLFIKTKWLLISAEGFSTLEKNTLICYQRVMLPLQ